MSDDSDHIVATATVRGGEFQGSHPDRLQTMLGQLEEGAYHIDITPLKASRSQQQNKYYWRVLTVVSDYTGHSPQELHAFFRQKFLARPLVFANQDGNVIEESQVAPSTSNLNVSEFYAYTELIRQWSAEQLGVDTPPPSK